MPVSAQVYPRERGGTWRIFVPSTPLAGLSPRARGNRRLQLTLLEAARSIPASAGEPAQRTFRPGLRRVYPRERGGTSILNTDCTSSTGLSPRARGNPRYPTWGTVLTGSIPASAGEPSASSRKASARGVYPRERGGTSWKCWTRRPSMGLSPRARGNRQRRQREEARVGSIPASAGEPLELNTLI